MEQTASQATRTAEATLKQEQERISNLQKQLAEVEVEKGDLLNKERQTIEYLVGEKASLKSELERLEGVETRTLLILGYFVESLHLHRVADSI
jgi:hypothetical protein